MRKRVKVSFYNSLEPRAEEGRNHSQPRTEEGGNITSNLTRKSEEVTRSSRTLNLVRKRGRASIHRESRTSRGGGREHYFRSRVKKWRSYEIFKKTLNLARTEEQSISLLKFPNLVRKGEGTSKQSSSKKKKNLNHARNKGQNIRYYHYGKFRMSQVTHF